MKKVVRDGKVAVIVSPGYGFGFYTYGAPVEAIFDPVLVELVENEKYKDAANYIEKTYPDAYIGDADLNVRWIPEGTKFRIDEYDGAENIVLLDETNYITA
jgi:hypothetical protein